MPEIMYLVKVLFPFSLSFFKDPGSIKNRIITGNYSYVCSITFNCNSGYQLRGSLVLTFERGAWNGSVPEIINKKYVLTSILFVQYATLLCNYLM